MLLFHQHIFWVSSYAQKYCQPIRLQASLKCKILRTESMMMFIFLHTDKHRSLLQVDAIILMSVTRHAQRTKNKFPFPYLCNLSIKAWGMKLILRLQINITFSNNVFYMIVSHWMRVARHVQSTENNKVTIFLQCLKENMKDEVNFLHADKCRRFF